MDFFEKKMAKIDFYKNPFFSLILEKQAFILFNIKKMDFLKWIIYNQPKIFS